MTEVALVACVAATLFMVGLTWFVQAVHYPLFVEVGEDRFQRYHELHSLRVTWVVVVPMVVELVSSLLLAIDPPEGLETLAVIGAVLAVAAWAVTVAWAAPTHAAIGRRGLEPALVRRLDRASLVRSLIWTLHGVVVVAMVARVVDLG